MRYSKEKGDRLILEDVDLKYPIAGGLLVKVEFCGVCFSDMFP